MGGGYSPDINDIIEAHLNTFQIAKYIFGWLANNIKKGRVFKLCLLIFCIIFRN
jgi:hypothetical protein